MYHRKLSSETETFNLTSLCEFICDPTQNTSGYCSPVCFISCPDASCFETTSPDVAIKTVHQKSHKLQEALIICFSIIGLCSLIYCVFTLFKLYKNRRRNLQEEQETRDFDEFVDEEHGPVLDHPIWYIRTVGLQSSTIDLITAIKYKRGEGLIEGTDCSVCLSEFEDDETLRLLPKCNHAFHLPCIDTWLRSHTSCPMCRAPILSNPNGTLSPILEQSFEGDSAVLEDSQVDVPEESEERERENENDEVGEVQSMRRSVSMDSIAALRLDNDVVAKKRDTNKGLKSFLGSCSFKKSLQNSPVLMKRSVSCSGKVMFPRHNQERNSVLPP